MDEVQELTASICEALSERLSRYGISQTGTIERDIAATIVKRALTVSPEKLEVAELAVAKCQHAFGSPIDIARAAALALGLKVEG